MNQDINLLDAVKLYGDELSKILIENIGDIAQFDLLIDVHIHLLHLLDAEGQLEVDTGIGDIGDLAEGGDHSLLLVIHGVEAGRCAAYYQKGKQNQQQLATQLFQIRFVFLFVRRLSDFYTVDQDIRRIPRRAFAA